MKKHAKKKKTAKKPAPQSAVKPTPGGAYDYPKASRKGFPA
jgi:hypothetical protein